MTADTSWSGVLRPWSLKAKKGTLLMLVLSVWQQQASCLSCSFAESSTWSHLRHSWFT